MAGHSHSPLDHVLDHDTIEIPWWSPPTYDWKIHLPSIGDFQITRFMVMEVIAGVLMIAVLVPVVRHIARKPVSRGWFVNMFEAMILFIRDEVARPVDRRPSRRPVPAVISGRCSSSSCSTT